jgi:hypothetical protein
MLGFGQTTKLRPASVFAVATCGDRGADRSCNKCLTQRTGGVLHLRSEIVVRRLAVYAPPLKSSRHYDAAKSSIFLQFRRSLAAH